MSIKNIFFGLGIGLICSGAILLFFRNQGNAELSDEEIKKRAEQLGMVESRQDAILTSEVEGQQKDTGGTSSEENPSEKNAGEAETEETGEEQESPENKTEDTENVQETGQQEINADSPEVQVPDKKKKEDTNSLKEKKKKKKKEETKQKDTGQQEAGETITVEITSGMTAGDICRLLKKQGVIEDAEDFKAYLVKKNIQHKLRAGTFKFSIEADYEEIVGEIYKGA